MNLRLIKERLTDRFSKRGIWKWNMDVKPGWGTMSNGIVFSGVFSYLMNLIAEIWTSCSIPHPSLLITSGLPLFHCVILQTTRRVIERSPILNFKTNSSRYHFQDLDVSIFVFRMYLLRLQSQGHFSPSFLIVISLYSYLYLCPFLLS